MKILVVHLLRLGDVVMMTPVIKGLRQKYPKAEIHVLLNRSVESIQNLIEGVDKFHYFEREALQTSVGSAEAPLFQGLECLEVWLKKLNSEKFDRVYNLTQNRLSALLVSQIQASQKVGMHYTEQGNVEFSSPWFKYLNDHIALGGREVFHYADLFQYGVGLEDLTSGLSLQESDWGQRQADTILQKDVNFVALQISTSDKKKEWAEASWIESLRQLQILNPALCFYVLGGESERARIESFIACAEAIDISIKPAICDLETAFSIVKRSRLLISLDTSIKHLAAAADVNILELCLGSSDERKTGAYMSGAVILRPRLGCMPCRHTESCYKKSHECSEKLSPSLVAVAAHHCMAHDWNGLRTIAREFSKEAHVFRVSFASGFWSALPLDSTDRRWTLENILSRSAWKLYLQESHKKLIGEYGSEGLRLKDAIPWIFPDLDTKERLVELRRIEDEMNEMDERLRTISQTLRSFARNNSDGSRLSHLSEKIQDWVESNADEVSSLQMLRLSSQIQLGDIPNIKVLRDLENHMRGFLDRQDIKMKIIRSLKTNSVENP